jgi:hypothetical protein
MQPILDIERVPAREGLFPRAVMTCRMDGASLTSFSAATSLYFSCLQLNGLRHFLNRTFAGIAEWHPCVGLRVSWGSCHA